MVIPPRRQVQLQCRPEADNKNLTHSVLTDAADRGFNNVHLDPMNGGRITSEEKSAISTYVGAGIAVLLAVVGIYFFFLTQKEKKETTTFDPNRPVPSDAVLKGRLKAEE